MESRIRKEILESYGDAVSDTALLNECVSICTTYNLNPSDLRYKLEAMNYKATNTRTEILPITLETLRAFKQQMQRGLARDSMKKAQAKARPANATASVDRSRLPGQMLKQVRHMDVDMTGPSAASSSSLPQIKRESMGISLSAGPSHVIFEGVKMDAESRKKRSYRYMYEKISERSEVLDQLIDDFAELIREQYDIGELADPSSTTDEDVTVVGRITHDPEVVSRKLTDGSLVIESSRMLSSGARVPLRLDKAINIRGAVQGTRGHGLFPGQIVALQGKNGGGGYFFATTILALPPLKPSPTSEGLIDPKADPGLGDKPATICIASGPYTPDTDLLYQPWRQFLGAVTSKKPHVLILIGPFVDAAHPKIKNGESETSPQKIFEIRFLNPLRKFLTISPSSIIVIIPSVRDMISDHCVFPQPELERAFEGIAGESRMIFQPNPARFKINDISFATTSVDVLYHLRTQEYLKLGSLYQPIPAREGDLAGDAMSSLCRHVLDQRSFYPIFPVPEELSHEVNLDVSHLDEARLVDDGELDYSPDVLIVPSRLKRFSDKVINTTLAINPSSVAKGSFVYLDIASKNDSPNLRDRLKAEFAAEPVQPSPTKPEPTA